MLIFLEASNVREAFLPYPFGKWKICLPKSNGFPKALWDQDFGGKKSSFAYRLTPSLKRQTQVGSGAEENFADFMAPGTSGIMISAVSFGEDAISWYFNQKPIHQQKK